MAFLPSKKYSLWQLDAVPFQAHGVAVAAHSADARASTAVATASTAAACSANACELASAAWALEHSAVLAASVRASPRAPAELTRAYDRR